jgi:hypothetical protein
VLAITPARRGVDTIAFVLANQKRRYPRANLNGTAQLSQGAFRCSGEVTTLSEGGVYVTGIPKLPVGADYRVHLILPRTFEPVVCRAEVIYNLPPSDGRKGGVGMRFTVISADALARISKLVMLLGALYEKLLAALTTVDPDRAAIETICYDLGLPTDLPNARLRWLVLQGVNQFRT